MKGNIDPFYRELRERLHAAERDMARIFMNYANGTLAVLDSPSAKFKKAFTLTSNEKLKRALSGENFLNFKKEMYGLTKNVVTGAWELGYKRNQGVVNKYLEHTAKVAGVEFDDIKQIYGTQNFNDKPLKAFLAGKGYGALSGHKGQPSLSSRVWKTAQQFRDEMTVHLGMGLANGDSAATVSRRIRKNLQNPDALFRRIKYTGTDKAGNPVEKYRWSKRAKNYHPGRGVYRSAFKNAMRVTRTTTNQSYWLADQENWRRQRFVESYEVKLSPNHPYPDICDELAGTYPKDFLFTGWHPHCFCYVTPNLMPPDKFIQNLKGKRVTAPKTTLPKGFQDWMKKNIDGKTVKGPNKPWWLSDNIKLGAKKGTYKFRDTVYHTADIITQTGPTGVAAGNYKTADEAYRYIQDEIGIRTVRSQIKKVPFEILKETTDALDLLVKRFKFKFGTMSVDPSTKAVAWARWNNELGLSKGYFMNPKKFKEALVRCEKNRFFPKGCNKVKSIIDHEYGHLLTVKDMTLNTKFGGDLMKVERRYRRWQKKMNEGKQALIDKVQKMRAAKEKDYKTIKYKYDDFDERLKAANELNQKYDPPMNKMMAEIRDWDDMVKNHKEFISEYADTNPKEFVAEAFSKFLNNPDPGQFSTDVFMTIAKKYKAQ